jgi:hypothetical protein
MFQQAAKGGSFQSLLAGRGEFINVHCVNLLVWLCELDVVARAPVSAMVIGRSIAPNSSSLLEPQINLPILKPC